MNKSKRLSQRRLALIAGISLLLMAIVAGFSYGYVHSSLVNPDDAQVTFENISAAQGLFTSEILGWTIIFFLDAIVAWALYLFFASTSKAISFVSSFLRVVYTLVLGVAIFNLPKVLQLINYQLADVGMDDTTSEVLHYLNSFDSTWSNGLIIFGLHLVVLGYLAYKAEYGSKIWGVLLILAGVSYTYVSGLNALAPELAESMATLETILAIPMTVGELGFAVWLLIKGGKGSN